MNNISDNSNIKSLKFFKKLRISFVLFSYVICKIMSQQYIKCPHCGQEIDLKKHLVDDSTKDKLLNEVKEDLKAGELNKDALAKKDLELPLEVR